MSTEHTERPRDALVAILADLLAHERDLQVEFLTHLADFDRRQLYLELGYSSLFDFCTRALGLLAGAAYRRIVGARLLRRFPAVAPLLRDGRLSLTTLALLRDVLSDDNAGELLARASRCSKEQVEALVALYRPGKAVRESVRPLPPPRQVAVPPVPPVAAAAATSGGAVVSGAARAAQEEPLTPALQPVVVTVARREPDRVQAVDADLRVLRVTVSRAFVEELAQVRAALSHKHPGGSFEDVVREGFRLILKEHARRTGAPARAASEARPPEPARPPEETPTPATVPSVEGAPPRHPAAPRLTRPHVHASLRRAVWRRDGGQCTFRALDGTRCAARHRLEIDHVTPVTWSGPTTLENLRLLCRAHNQHNARLTLGAALMARYAGATSVGGGHAIARKPA